MYIPIYRENRLIIEFWVFHTPELIIHSNIPHELILEVGDEIVSSIKDIESTNWLRIYDAFIELSTAIEKHPSTSFFLYPSVLFQGSDIISEFKEEFMLFVQGKGTISEGVYSERVNPVKHAGLRWHYMKTQFLEPSRFKKEAKTIERSLFEAQIKDELVAQEYVRHYNDHNLFYFAKEGGYFFFVLSTGFHPDMILVKKVDNG